MRYGERKKARGNNKNVKANCRIKEEKKGKRNGGRKSWPVKRKIVHDGGYSRGGNREGKYYKGKEEQ